MSSAQTNSLLRQKYAHLPNVDKHMYKNRTPDLTGQQTHLTFLSCTGRRLNYIYHQKQTHKINKELKKKRQDERGEREKKDQDNDKKNIIPHEDNDVFKKKKKAGRKKGREGKIKTATKHPRVRLPLEGNDGALLLLLPPGLCLSLLPLLSLLLCAWGRAPEIRAREHGRVGGRRGGGVVVTRCRSRDI